jgi:hypothetical protein
MSFSDPAVLGNYLSSFSLAAALYSNLLADEHHKDGLSKQRELQEREIRNAFEMHFAEVMLSKRLQMIGIHLSTLQHIQSLDADVISSSKEAERDMYEQRSQEHGTIILSSTIMFSALCTVMFQAQLPLDSGFEVEIAMSIAAGASFFFLFISIVLCTKIVIRSSKYM